jgi:DNA-binding CsgD family transcriptional regulator/pimeloyl-ACP methyl ester carboxylesterase
MEPPIRYARTADGVGIAFTTFGTGPPLVLLPGVPFECFHLEWQIPEQRAFYEALGRRLTVTQYDARGTGLSQRDASDFSLGAMLADLEAVIAAVGLARFGLLGRWNSGLYAIAYAAQHPERVTGLALWGGFARGPEGTEAPQIRALLSLIERDWALFSETAAHLWLGWSVGAAARRFAEVFRAASTPQQARAALDAAAAIDVTPLLVRVAVPTLVLHRRGFEPSAGPARALAAGIPHARLVVLEGESPSPLALDQPSAAPAIVAFFVDDDAPLPAADAAATADSSPTAPAGLTRREVEVLVLLARGDSNQEIARRLQRSVHTVERHVANIYRKIDARGRADATAFALRNRLA